MDKFPEDFNRPNINKTIELGEEELVKYVRKRFHDEINQAAKNLEETVELIFPDKLWFKHRKTITEELLSILGELQIGSINDKDKTVVLKATDDPTKIPDKVNFIKIILNVKR